MLSALSTRVPSLQAAGEHRLLQPVQAGTPIVMPLACLTYVTAATCSQ